MDDVVGNVEGELRDSEDRVIATVEGWAYGNGHLSVQLRNGDYLSVEVPLDDLPLFPQDYGWDDLIRLLDEHWPEDLFPTLPDRESRDPGPRIVSLLRWLERERQFRTEIIEALRDPKNQWWHTGGTPCVPRRVLLAVLSKDWVDDETLPREDVLKRFWALGPEPTTGPPERQRPPHS